jgi:DNA-nicking Smr family endonuclease
VVRKREVRDEEQALWQEAMRDVRRSRRKRPSVAVGEKRVDDKAKQFAAAVKSPLRPAAKLAPKRPATGVGLDGSTAEKLKRGKIEPEATLDLHGLTQAQAHSRLNAFVRHSAESGRRCVLVVTGKGAPSSQSASEKEGFVMPTRTKSGVLRLMVPRWLNEGDAGAVVAGSQVAHQRHGGDGALYVYLRRKRT